MPDEAKLMPLATLAISIVQIINKLYFLTVADDLHERLWAEAMGCAAEFASVWADAIK